MKWIKRNTVAEKHVWHKWFAWHPVVIGKTPDKDPVKVWLKTIYRCGELNCCLDGCFWTWEYRETMERK